MSTIGTLVALAAVLGGSVEAVVQVPKPVTPDLARLTDGKSAQVFTALSPWPPRTAARSRESTRGPETEAFFWTGSCSGRV
jgi:hypothetical protein